jgi:hypothetical protein
MNFKNKESRVSGTRFFARRVWRLAFFAGFCHLSKTVTKTQSVSFKRFLLCSLTLIGFEVIA